MEVSLSLSAACFILNPNVLLYIRKVTSVYLTFSFSRNYGRLTNNDLLSLDPLSPAQAIRSSSAVSSSAGNPQTVCVWNDLLQQKHIIKVDHFLQILNYRNWVIVSGKRVVMEQLFQWLTVQRAPCAVGSGFISDYHCLISIIKNKTYYPFIYNKGKKVAVDCYFN